MGAHGALTLKPTKLWSTASGPEHRFAFCLKPRMSSCWCPYLSCRRWIRKLRVKVSKAKRAKLRARSERLKVVIKKQKADGTVCVSLVEKNWTLIWKKIRDQNAHYSYVIMSSLFLLRSGGPSLKSTQVYPALYGQRVSRFHRKFQDWLQLTLSQLKFSTYTVIN